MVSVNLVFSQTSFDGHDFYFDSGNCDSLITEDSEQFLALSNGNCDDKVQVNFPPTNGFLLETTGIYWSDSANINLKIGSSSENFEVVLKKLPFEDKVKIILIGDHFSELKTSNGNMLLSGVIDTVTVAGFGNHPEEVISIVDIIYHAQDSNSYLSFIFAGSPEITANQDTFFMSWVTINLNSYIDSIDNFELSYSSFENIIGVVGFNSQAEKISISWIPSEIKAGDDVIISGNNLNFLEGVFLNDEQIDFLLIDSQSIRVFWPEILPDSGDVIFVGAINTHIETNVPIEDPFPTPIFDDFTSILFEDSSYTLYLKWNDPEYTFTGDYRVMIEENYFGEGSPPELYQNTIITTENEIILTGLPLGDGYRVRLQKYNQGESSFVPSDLMNLRHEITSGEFFMLMPKSYAILRDWGLDSTNVDLVTFLYNTQIHTIAVRALLQEINNGKGFNDSSRPWFSDEGTIISLIPTVPDDPDPPEPDTKLDRGCVCQLYTSSHGLHSADGHNQNLRHYREEQWLMPRVYKDVGKDKDRFKRWMRTQKLGAAVYREVFTQINSMKGTRYNYFLNYDHGEAQKVPSASLPSQDYSSIKIQLNCFAIVNGLPIYPPCVDICKTSAHLKYRYTSKHHVELKMYKSALNSYARTYGGDEAYLLMRHTDVDKVVNKEFIWGGAKGLDDWCESSFNTDFLRAFGRFAGNIAQYVGFDTLGLSFDLEELLSSSANVEELFNALGDLLDTEFIHRDGNCDETTRSIPLNSQNDNYHFEIGHGDEFIFTLFSQQSIGSRVLRARARTKIATDFHFLLNIGDLGYTSNKYIENRDSCCIWSRSSYLIGSHDTLYVGKNSIPYPLNPTFLEDQLIVATTYNNHMVDVQQNIPQELLDLLGGYLPVDKNHLHEGLMDYIHCTPNTPPGASTGQLISSSQLKDYRCDDLKGHIKIYPNPVGSSDIMIEINKPEIALEIKGINIYGNSGQLLRNFSSPLKNNERFTTFTIPNHIFQESGLFFIELESSGGFNIVKPIIIQR